MVPQNQGNMVIHSRKKARYLCTTCGAVSADRRACPSIGSATRPPASARCCRCWCMAARLRRLSLPLTAMSAPASRCQSATGRTAKRSTKPLVQHGPLDLRQVQADEPRVKTQAGIFWMALAIAVSPRLWLGGGHSDPR